MVYEIIHMELAGMSFSGALFSLLSWSVPILQFKKKNISWQFGLSRLASRRIEISSWQRMTVDGSEIRRLPVDVKKIPFYA